MNIIRNNRPVRLDALIMDIDGCLAHNDEEMRKTFLEQSMSFDEFKSLYPVYEVNNWAKSIMKRYEGVQRLIITNRSLSDIDVTSKWLHDNQIPYEQLHTRPESWNPIRDVKFKERVYLQRLRPYYKPILAVDDHKAVVDMWMKHNIPALHYDSRSYTKQELGDIL